MKKKHWKLAKWCFLHMKTEINKDGYCIYAKCRWNDLLIKLLNMSNVTPVDAAVPDQFIKNLKYR